MTHEVTLLLRQFQEVQDGLELRRSERRSAKIWIHDLAETLQGDRRLLLEKLPTSNGLAHLLREHRLQVVPKIAERGILLSKLSPSPLGDFCVVHHDLAATGVSPWFWYLPSRSA